MNRFFFTAAALFSLLFLTACSTEISSPEPADEPTPEPIRAEQLLHDAAQKLRTAEITAPESAEEMYRYVVSAWDGGASTETASSGSPSRSDSGGDVIVRQGDTVLVLRGKSLIVLDLSAGFECRVAETAVGFDWTEEYEEDGWTGKEKAPAELFVFKDRLIVVSDWFEYRETAWTDSPRFLDRSHTCVDIFDLSELSKPMLIASYGQDGYECCAGVADGRVILVTQRNLFEEDCAEPAACVPCTYNGEERRPIPIGDVGILSSEPAALYTLTAVYDPQKCTMAAAKALFGDVKTVFLHDGVLDLFSPCTVKAELVHPEDSSLLLSEENSGTMIVRAGISDSGPEWTGAAIVSGELDGAENAIVSDDSLILYTRSSEICYEKRDGAERVKTEERSEALETVLSGGLEILEERRSDAPETETGELTLPWGRGTLTLLSTEKSVELSLCSSENGEVYARRSLGYEYHTAFDNPDAIWIDEPNGVIGLPAEDSFTFFRVKDWEIGHMYDLYTWDNGVNFRLMEREDTLFILDTSRIRAVSKNDYTLRWERFF